MEDTALEVKQKFYEILMKLTEEERFLMCAEMFESAKEIIVSEMPETLNKRNRQSYIYEKIYKEAFPIILS